MMGSRALPIIVAMTAALSLTTVAATGAAGDWPEPAESWQELLQLADANDDGSISKGEFQGPDRAFVYMDADDDGTITRGEALAHEQALAVAVAFMKDGDRAVATVNGVAITQAALSTRMAAATGRDELKDLIDRELIRQAADQAGVAADEEELQKEIARAKQGFPSEEAFQQFLATSGRTMEEWIAEVRMALIARQLTLKDVTCTDEDLKQFFGEHKDRYNLPLRVSLSEIVVPTEADADRIVAELRVDPERFAELARVYSLSPYTKSRGGKRPEDMPVDRIQSPEVRQLVTTLPIGEISDAMRVALGENEQWYILRVDDRKPARESSFEEDKEKITHDYQSVHARQLRDIINEQAEVSDVVVLDPRFQGLNEDYGP